MVNNSIIIKVWSCGQTVETQNLKIMVWETKLRVSISYIDIFHILLPECMFHSPHLIISSTNPTTKNTIILRAHLFRIVNKKHWYAYSVATCDYQLYKFSTVSVCDSARAIATSEGAIALIVKAIRALSGESRHFQL